MKNIVFITLLMLSYSIGLFGQTADAEKKRLTERYQQKDFDAVEYAEFAKEWNAVLNKMGGYPDLPYNSETEKIEFTFSKTFSDLSKEIIFDRIMEWCAINYGNLSYVLHYENFESGKIIVKGWFNIFNIKHYGKIFNDQFEQTKCDHIFVFTLSDKSLKLEATRLNYTFTQLIWSSNLTYTEQSYNIPIQLLYPITDGDTGEWGRRLSILYETNKRLKSYATDLFKYIGNYNKDYEF